jgi:hypothetical protein
MGKELLGNRPFKSPMQNFAYNILWLIGGLALWDWLWPNGVFDTGLGNLTISMIFRMIVCILIGGPMIISSIVGMFQSNYDDYVKKNSNDK